LDFFSKITNITLTSETGKVINIDTSTDFQMYDEVRKDEEGNKICSRNCWDYDKCLKRNTKGMVACFRKNESICHYCINESNCKNASNTMFLCTKYERRI
jgi:hypothetical protein